MSGRVEGQLICPDAPDDIRVKMSWTIGLNHIKRDKLTDEQKDWLASEWRKKLDEPVITTQRNYNG